MKTIVLALDGFEISFMEKLGLDEFKQKNYGTYDVSMLERTFTPICFAAILSGKDPRDFGYTHKYLTKAYQEGYPPWLKPIYWIRRNFFGWVKSFGIRTELAKKGVFKLEEVQRNLNEDMKKHTILRRLEMEGHSINPIDIPSYNEEFSTAHAMFPNYINKELYIRQTYLRDLMKKIIQKWLNAIEAIDKHDLTFIYSKLPDVAHHLISHVNELPLIEEIYVQLSEIPYLFELKNVAVLILSDHGYKHRFREDGKDIEGDHHPFGFWSINVDTTIKPATVFDFYGLIHELVTK